MKHSHNDSRLNEEGRSTATSRLLRTPVILCILVTEAGERFTYYGFRAVLVLYFREALQYDDSRAIALYSFTTSLAYFSPLAGALVADGLLGRYKTILYFGLVYVVGLVILTLAAWADENCPLESKRLITFLGLFLVCMGTGGIKPCVSAFGADQVQAQETQHHADQDADSLRTKDASCCPSEGEENLGFSSNPPVQQGPGFQKGGEQNSLALSSGLAEPPHETTFAAEDSQKQRKEELLRGFFAYFYFCINVGCFASITLVPILRGHYGFYAAFLLLVCFMVTAMLLFISKRKSYKQHIPGQDGGSLIMIFSLTVWLIRHQLASSSTLMRIFPFVRPRSLSSHRHGRAEHELVPTEEDHETASQTSDTRSSELDSSSSEEAGVEDPVLKQQLDDAAQALKVLPVLAMLPVFWCLHDQQGSAWTLQADRMELHGLQPEQMSAINPLQIMIFIPLFDRVIYPAMEAKRWDIAPLRRMSWGMFFTAAAFFASGLVESAIQNHRDVGLSKINVFWQLPQITLLTIGEVFLSVTGLEFAYSTSPQRLKAFLVAVYLLTIAAGDLMSGVLYSTIFVNLTRATAMYICALLMLCNLGVFWRVSRWYYEMSNYEGPQHFSSVRSFELPDLS